MDHKVTVFIFLNILLIINSTPNICKSQQYNLANEIARIRDESLKQRELFYILIFGSKFLLIADKKFDFKEISSFSSYLNENFNQILTISLYCADPLQKGFHLVLIHHGAVISEKQINHVSVNYLKKLLKDEEIQDKINKNLKTNLLQLQMKTEILKNQVKLQKLKNSLAFEKRKFDVNFNQKIMSIENDKAKYEMKLSSKLIDVGEKNKRSFIFEEMFSSQTNDNSHSTFALLAVFCLSLIMIILVKHIIDWLVSIKSKNLPSLNLDFRQSQENHQQETLSPTTNL